MPYIIARTCNFSQISQPLPNRTPQSPCQGRERVFRLWGPTHYFSPAFQTCHPLVWDTVLLWYTWIVWWAGLRYGRGQNSSTPPPSVSYDPGSNSVQHLRMCNPAILELSQNCYPDSQTSVAKLVSLRSTLHLHNDEPPTVGRPMERPHIDP